MWWMRVRLRMVMESRVDGFGGVEWEACCGHMGVGMRVVIGRTGRQLGRRPATRPRPRNCRRAVHPRRPCARRPAVRVRVHTLRAGASMPLPAYAGAPP